MGNGDEIWAQCGPAMGNNNSAPGIAKQPAAREQFFPENQTGSSHLGPELRREVNIYTDPKMLLAQSTLMEEFGKSKEL